MLMRMGDRAMRRRLAAVVLLMLPAACGGEAATRPAETVAYVIKEKTFHLEIADDDAERARGLMERERLAADGGMLFVMGHSGVHHFWMKNTLIDLDALWVNEEGEIVHVATMKAGDETTHSNRRAAAYIIELRAGTAKALGLGVGDKITPPGKVLKPAATGPDNKS